MNAYKFLRPGAIGPFSGVRWPAPGEWLEVRGQLEVCVNGIHACSRDTLAYWLGEELWSVELDGEIHDEGTVLVASRARLVSGIDAWPRVARDFADACAERARDLAERAPENPRVKTLVEEAARQAERAEEPRRAVAAAYAAAVAGDAFAPGGFDAERTWQSRTLDDLVTLRIWP